MCRNSGLGGFRNYNDVKITAEGGSCVLETLPLIDKT